MRPTRPAPCARCSPPPSTTPSSRATPPSTGPIVRGDLGTVRAHLEDITANAPQTLGSYVALARATLDRAVTDGRIVPIRAARIRDLLDAAVAGRNLREVR